MSDDPSIQSKLSPQYDISQQDNQNLDPVEHRESEWKGHECAQLDAIDEIKISTTANSTLNSSVAAAGDTPLMIQEKHDVKVYHSEKTEGEKAIEEMNHSIPMDSGLGKALEKIVDYVLSKLG